MSERSDVATTQAAAPDGPAVAERTVPALARPAGRAVDRVRPFLVAGAYLLLVLVFTWPLAAHLGDGFVLTGGADLWQHVWNFAWVRTALLTLHQSPYYTYSIYYPTGVPLVYHALNLFSAAVSIPLQVALGLVPAFNLLLLGNLVAAALAAYWLARVLGLGVPAAFLAGLLYGCSAPVGASFGHGQGELVSVFWMPLYIGLLLRGAGWRARGLPPGRRGYLVAAGLALVGSVLAIYYWFVCLLLFTAVYGLFELWGAARAGGRAAVWPLLGRLALVGGVALLLLSPLGLLLLREQSRGGTDLGIARSPTSDAVVFSSSQDLLSFILPAPAHIDPAATDIRGANLGPGWTALVLAGLAVALARGARRRGLVLWLALSAILVVLALGPILQINGGATGLTLPYDAILNVPGAAAMRVPLRFLTLLALCLAVLAATGLAELLGRIRAPGARAGVAALALVLAGLELFAPPRPLVSAATAPFFQQLGTRPSPCLGTLPAAPAGCGAILEVPFPPWSARAMFDAAVSGHPIVGGYTSRHYPYSFIADMPGVAQLAAADPAPLAADIVTPAVRDTALEALDYYGVRYVVVHPLAGDPQAGDLRRVLGTLFPGPGTPSGDLTVYTVPPSAQDRPIVGLGAGWYDIEHDPAGARWRWTDGQADVAITVPPAAAGAYTLTLDVYALTVPRTLAVTFDGQALGRFPAALPPGSPVTLPLTLRPGMHTLLLASVEPAVAPPGDSRRLSLGYHALRLTRP